MTKLIKFIITRSVHPIAIIGLLGLYISPDLYTALARSPIFYVIVTIFTAIGYVLTTPDPDKLPAVPVMVVTNRTYKDVYAGGGTHND